MQRRKQKKSYRVQVPEELRGTVHVQVNMGLRGQGLHLNVNTQGNDLVIRNPKF